MAEQNVDCAEDKMMGHTDEEIKDRLIAGGDGFGPLPNPKGGGNTIGGKDAKPMKTGDKATI